MSGPIVPPLEVTEVDGSPDGRPITKLIVSSGDLTISGRTATIDTSGSATTPAGSDTEIQFNDGGAFGASSQFTYTTAANLGRIGMTTGASATQAEIRALDGHGLQIGSSDVTASALRSYILFYGENDAPTGLSILSAATGGDISIKTTGTGATEIGNLTTNQDTTLQVAGNGTGKPVINLKNDAMSASLEVTTNNELTIKGGTESFAFDVSSATGGMTFPDGTELKSAEGTAILSTGEAGATKFLREDGDGTCSWQAAGGGGGVSVALPNIGSSSETMYLISNSPVWGTTDVSTTQSVGIQNKPTAFPFIAPKTGDLTAMLVQVTTGSASNAYVAIYSADSDNLPSTLLGYTTIDVTSTGQIEQTSFSSTVSLVAGTLYYFSLCIDGSSSAVLQATDNVDVPNIGIGSTLTEASVAFYDNSRTSYDVPPATYTPSFAVADNRAIVGVKY